MAAVEFDDSVGRLHGRVVNSAYPIATFEATDVDGIRREFERSIDEYLASCREDDVEPKKPFSGTLNLRLGPDLHQRAALSAGAHGHPLRTPSPSGSAPTGDGAAPTRALTVAPACHSSMSQLVTAPVATPVSQLDITACHSSGRDLTRPSASR